MELVITYMLASISTTSHTEPLVTQSDNVDVFRD